MADDLLNSMLSNSSDDENNDLNDLLDKVSTDTNTKGGDADALSSLLGGLMGGGETQQPQGGDLGSLLGGLMGGGGDASAGGMEGMLGALLGGGASQGGDAGGMLGGLMGNQQPSNLDQMPIIGPMITSLAEKFGLPPSMAAGLITTVLGMLMSGKGKSSSGRTEDIDLGSLVGDLVQDKDAIAQVASETGLDENKASEAVQDVLKMLAQPPQD